MATRTCPRQLDRWYVPDCGEGTKEEMGRRGEFMGEPRHIRIPEKGIQSW